MRCDEIERELSCYIDGELAPPEHREIENHLSECAGCRHHVESVREVKQVLRQKLPCEAPPGLVSRVQVALDGADGETGWLSRFVSSFAPLRALGRSSAGILVPVAAALALVLAYVETVEPLITESIVKHQRNLPLEVTGGPEIVQSWFDGKVPFAVPTLKLGPNCSLRGGRLSHLGSRDAALLQYDRQGQKVSVFVFDAQSIPLPLRLRAPERRVIANREVFIDGKSGYHVAVFRNRGLGYAITGSGNESDFIQMISVVVGQVP